MSGDLIELEQHEATVESTIARLDREKDNIKYVIAIVETKDGEWLVYADRQQSVGNTAALVSVSQEHLRKIMFD